MCIACLEWGWVSIVCTNDRKKLSIVHRIIRGYLPATTAGNIWLILCIYLGHAWGGSDNRIMRVKQVRGKNREKRINVSNLHRSIHA
nr:hypothetical protein Q903MT_gene1915 [Picea sitchensis]